MRKKHDYYPQIATATIDVIRKERIIYQDWIVALTQIVDTYRKNKLKEYPEFIKNAFHQYTQESIANNPSTVIDRFSSTDQIEKDALVKLFQDQAVIDSYEKWGGLDLIKKHYCDWYACEHSLHNVALTHLRTTENNFNGNVHITARNDSLDKYNISIMLEIDEEGEVDGPITIETNPNCRFHTSQSAMIPCAIAVMEHEQVPSELTQDQIKSVLLNKDDPEGHSATKVLFVKTLFNQVLQGANVDLNQFSELLSSLRARFIWDAAEVYCKTLQEGPDDAKQWTDWLRHLHRLIVLADKDKNYTGIVDEILGYTIASCTDKTQKVELLIALNDIKDDGSRFGDYLNNYSSKLCMLTQNYQPAIDEYNEKLACVALSDSIESMILDVHKMDTDNIDKELTVSYDNSL
ncbi:hypothetical protein [Shewanella aestuarii]|uniref:Uncharacterized protein n=1 Tax=Shewanella aestuarii TaxID=1028752 RepID=A0A6G9QPQ7_9GAMM|nr:hypothetical protein [Shewanella aestuarii]QIR16574.1 hypothetical protein HBH39_19050 [Shewanella aestuarii]